MIALRYPVCQWSRSRFWRHRWQNSDARIWRSTRAGGRRIRREVCLFIQGFSTRYCRFNSIRNRTAKFSNVSSITLFFPAAQGAETTQIYYVGFLGHWTEVCAVIQLLGSVGLIAAAAKKPTSHHSLWSTGEYRGPSKDTRHGWHFQYPSNITVVN